MDTKTVYVKEAGMSFDKPAKHDPTAWVMFWTPDHKIEVVTIPIGHWPLGL